MALIYVVVVYSDLRPRSKLKSKINLKYSSQSTWKATVSFDFISQISQGHLKVLAVMI